MAPPAAGSPDRCSSLAAVVPCRPVASTSLRPHLVCLPAIPGHPLDSHPVGGQGRSSAGQPHRQIHGLTWTEWAPSVDPSFPTIPKAGSDPAAPRLGSVHRCAAGLGYKKTHIVLDRLERTYHRTVDIWGDGRAWAGLGLLLIAPPSKR